MPYVTFLRLLFKEKAQRNRLLFPKLSQMDSEDKNKDQVSFAEDQLLCFVREEFKRRKFCPTVLYVIRTVSPGMQGSNIEGVSPGAKILLFVRGETKVKRNVAFLTTMLENNVALKDWSDNVWNAIHSRNEANISLDFLAERLVEDSKIK